MKFPEWYIKIDGEDEMRLYQDEAEKIEKFLDRKVLQPFIKIRGSRYKSRDIKYLKKIMVEYGDRKPTKI